MIAVPVPLIAGLVAAVVAIAVLVVVVILEARRQVMLYCTLTGFLAQMGSYTRLDAALNGASAMLCRATGARLVLLYIQDSEQGPLVLKGRYSAGGLENAPEYIDEPRWPRPKVGDVFLAKHCDLSLFDMTSGGDSRCNCAALVAPISAWERVMGYALVVWREGHIPAGSDRLCMGVGQYLGVLLERLLMYEALRAQALSSEETVMDLRQLTRAQQETVWSILHDMRHPLGLAHGYLELALERLPGESEIARCVRGARAGLGRAMQMADDLLIADLPQREQVAPGPVDVGELLEEVAVQAAGLMSGSEIELAVTVAPGTGQANADERRLYRIVLNLVLNAVKHTAAGGKVALEAYSDDGKVIITVSDTGRGMPDAELQALLSGPLDEMPGSGRLGLMIVRRLAAEMGATLTGKSAPGQGVFFEIALPQWSVVQRLGELGVLSERAS